MLIDVTGCRWHWQCVLAPITADQLTSTPRWMSVHLQPVQLDIISRLITLLHKPLQTYHTRQAIQWTGDILTDKRCRLSLDNAEKLLILKENLLKFWTVCNVEQCDNCWLLIIYCEIMIAVDDYRTVKELDKICCNFYKCRLGDGQRGYTPALVFLLRLCLYVLQ